MSILHLARAYLTASGPAFVERTWQTVMEQLQSRGKDSRHRKFLETTTDDFFAVFKQGKVSIVHSLKRLHNLALSLG